MRLHHNQSLSSIKHSSSSNPKSWLTRLTAKEMSQLTSVQTATPVSPIPLVTDKDIDLEHLVKSIEPALQTIETPPRSTNLSESDSLWDNITEQESEQDTDLILEPLDEIKPLDLDFWDDQSSAELTSESIQQKETLLHELSLENDLPPENIFTLSDNPPVLPPPPEPLANEMDTTDDDLVALLNSFDQPDNAENPPPVSDDEVEASNEEISSFLASFQEQDSPDNLAIPQPQNSPICPEIVEFDDDNLEQQIDDMLDDMVLHVTAVKTPLNSSTSKPTASNLIVDDDLEIEIEFEIADQELSPKKQQPQAEPPKKDAAKMKRYGGLLSDFDNIEEDTELIALTQKTDSSKPDPLLTLLEQGVKAPGESVEQRLTHLVSASGNSEEIKELCSLVAQAYGINSQFLKPPEGQSENQNLSIVNTDPLTPLKNELEHELSLLLSNGSSLSGTSSPQADGNNSPPQSLPSTIESQPTNNENEEIEQLLRELEDSNDTTELDEFTIELDSAQKKTDEPLQFPVNSNTDAKAPQIATALSSHDSKTPLWTQLEKELREKNPSASLDIEIEINELVQFKPNDTTTLLFDILGDELLNPTKPKLKPVFVNTDKVTKLENQSLAQAFKQYESETKSIAKLKAEGKYVDPRKRFILPSYHAPSLWRRICAACLDLALYIVLASVLTVLFFVPWDIKIKLLNFSAIEPEYLALQTASIFGLIVLTWIFVGVTLIISQGRSFGQKLLKLELQNPGAPTIYFSQAVIYITTQIFSFLLFLPGLLWVFGKNRKTLHDHLSGLVVSSSAK